MEIEQRWIKLHEEGFANNEAARRATLAMSKKQKEENKKLQAAQVEELKEPAAEPGGSNEAVVVPESAVEAVHASQNVVERAATPTPSQTRASALRGSMRRSLKCE